MGPRSSGLDSEPGQVNTIFMIRQSATIFEPRMGITAAVNMIFARFAAI